MLNIFGTVLDIIIVIIALVGVIKAADIFVDNIIVLGKHAGISEIVLGVTTAAIGTSLPEFGSTLIAVVSGSVDIGLGNIFGSNIWNIGGILGITALFVGTIICEKSSLNRDGVMSFVTTAILMICVVIFGSINFYVGLILVIIYVIYLYILIKTAEDEDKEKHENEEVKIDDQTKPEVEKPLNIPKSLLLAIGGIIGLFIGCYVLVALLTDLSVVFGIPQIIMGLILGVCTSLPELVTVINSTKRGLNNLAVGTIVGSNTFNILIGLGLPALFNAIPVPHTVMIYDLPMLLIMTIMLILLGNRKGKLSKADGFIIFAFYIIYCIGKVFFFTG